MNIKLLLVEDDNEAIAVMKTLIERKLPEVTLLTAENGRAGLRMFREHQPDIVITDINMPDLDGIMMAEEMKSMKENTRFIVITGYSDKMDSFGGIGIQDYFVKPTDLRRLLASIENCIGQVRHERGE
jgi:YesN/AraC family two-component response regulator